MRRRDKSNAVAVLTLALLTLPVSLEAAQTFDPADPAFDGGEVVTLDDLTLGAIAGSSLFVFGVAGLDITFSTPGTFSFACVGPGGLSECILAAGEPITISASAPLAALGFTLHRSESSALTIDFDGVSADETVVFDSRPVVDFFFGAYDLGGILSVVLPPGDFGESVWRDMRFVVGGGGGCSVDAECSDGAFCNGPETCDVATGVCQPGMEPCGPDELCDEDRDTCEPAGVPCSDDPDCPFGELCDPDTSLCVPGTPCASDSDCGAGQMCLPSQGVCVPGAGGCSSDADCAPLGQVCGPDSLCVDSGLMTGLELIEIDLDLDVEPTDPTLAQTTPTLGESFGVVVELPILEGELQPARIDIFVPDALQVDFPEPGSLMGELALVLADIPLLTTQIYTLDPEPTAVYLDLDGNTTFDLGEPLAAVQSGSTIFNVQLPSGGDGDAEVHLVPADGEVRLDVERILTPTEPGAHVIRVIATGVDPDTGGPSDGAGIVPRLRLQDFEVEVLLPIDVKPDSESDDDSDSDSDSDGGDSGGSENTVNPNSQGVIPVAILSDQSFHAPSVIDSLSAAFGPGRAVETHGQGHIEDIDGDGDTDLLFHFSTPETGIVCGATEVELSAMTLAGELVRGVDSVRTVGCD